MASREDPRLSKVGVSGYNKPKRTLNHKTISHVVVAKVGDKIKTIRFGQQGVSGNGKNPKFTSVKAMDSSSEAAYLVAKYSLKLTGLIDLDASVKMYEAIESILDDGGIPSYENVLKVMNASRL